ncbi:hypothetical protein B0G75_10818 [Paraburkholderia sp. BL18I3N2]|uniref:hypothetical protein n=1 Tax=Paraburkholderia sp. BL18I3N2 TaxID=1938799 RepID=UPI000D4B94C8|nr:hypothetical protein [Paraburkholderia sp. BL18I3N2]PRX29528.1 hypothetical protein B0G75_10818 [Paraburkholderia sp. BL18I3N2]
MNVSSMSPGCGFSPPFARAFFLLEILSTAELLCSLYVLVPDDTGKALEMHRAVLLFSGGVKKCWLRPANHRKEARKKPCS